MKQLQFMRLICAVFGVALIVAGFMVFGSALPDSVMYLDIAVSIIAFVLCIVEIFRRFDSEDASSGLFASLGLRLTGVFLYVVLAVIAMVVLQLKDVEFTYQLLCQSALLFLVFIWFSLAESAYLQSPAVHARETAKLRGRADMKAAARSLVDEAALKDDVPGVVKDSFAGLSDSIRYISPCDGEDAARYEAEFVDSCRSMASMLHDYTLNADRIASELKRARMIIERRKECLSTK